jgi:hypothetical protein
MLQTYILSVYPWNKLSERRFLQDTLGMPEPTEFPEDASLIAHKSCFIILSSPSPNIQRVLNAVALKALETIVIFHLGDEFLNKADRKLYDLKECVRIFRNYYDPVLDSLDKVTTFPLGPMNYKPNNYTRPERTLVWSFAGDTNKATRKTFLKIFSEQLSPYKIHEIKSWCAKDSLSASLYSDLLDESLFVPCPPGNLNLDTFRLYECLESGGLPIVLRSTTHQNFDYWKRLFKNFALDSGDFESCALVVDTWQEAVHRIKELLENKTKLELKLQAVVLFWKTVKQQMKKCLHASINP